ncbi:uncharacterized protein [Rutidosis leptorrhynchoides]|uniref:uncharacterized protein n=1 Tax=Rutidosis leptorrhynchoides TaxID=125765 RepID=UPI003A99F0FC
MKKVMGKTFAIAFADMVSTVLRMNGKTDVFLSPQILIDANCEDLSTAVDFATNEELGFESQFAYPFFGIPRSISRWSEDNYTVSKRERHRIDDVKCFFGHDEIKSAILANFAEGGRKYPLVGILRCNDFVDRQVAAVASMETMPYRFPVNTPPAQGALGSSDRHAVLIVGVDTTFADPEMHFCEVKSSHGKKWGVDGFSKVGFGEFDVVLVPYYG